MKLHAVDVFIILCYFLTVILIGLWVSRRGAKDLDSYFLGSKSLPWYLLGISDASGMFDISGTMWMVSRTPQASGWLESHMGRATCSQANGWYPSERPCLVKRVDLARGPRTLNCPWRPGKTTVRWFRRTDRSKGLSRSCW